MTTAIANEPAEEQDLNATIEALIAAGPSFAADLRQRLLDFGPTAIPRLIEILEDDRLALADSPGDGMAPVHAVEILAEMKAVDAIEPMLAALIETDWEDILHDRLLVVMKTMGVPVQSE